VRNHHELPGEDRSATPAKRGHARRTERVQVSWHGRRSGALGAGPWPITDGGCGANSKDQPKPTRACSPSSDMLKRRRTLDQRAATLQAMSGDAARLRRGATLVVRWSLRNHLVGDRMPRPRPGRHGDGSFGVRSKEARRRSASRSRKNLTISARVRPASTL
jgi:hypothetical protein